MNKTTRFTLILSAAFAVTLPALAADDTAPVKLDPEKRAGLNLTAIPPDAYKDILVAGELNMRVASLFEGKELRVSIFESTPAKTQPLDNQLRASIKQIIVSTNQRNALTKFGKEYQDRWRGKTECAKDYVVPDCSNSKAKTTTTAPPGAVTQPATTAPDTATTTPSG